MFGYAKPVPYNPRYFKDPRRDDVIVGLAGPSANLAMAALAAAVAWGCSGLVSNAAFANNELFAYFYVMFLPTFALINLYLMFFNLLPIPPLDGSSIFAILLPPKYLPKYYQIQQYAFPVFMIAIVVLPYVFNFNPFSWYLGVTAGNLFDFMFPPFFLWGSAISTKSTRRLRGPFDLLLYLVSRQKVDIGAISITEIADQYLAEVSRMETLDLDVASDFLLVASTLLEIKAQSLIPPGTAGLTTTWRELAPIEARDMLVRRLMEYKVQERRRGAHTPLHSAGVACTRPSADPRLLGLCRLPGRCRLDALAYQAAAALARREVFLLESEHIAAKPIPVEVHVRAIHQHALKRASKHLRFSQLVGPGTPKDVAVVTFLAILELYKRVMVRLEQDELFGDIAIDYIEGSGDLRLEGDDALTSVGEE